MALLATNQTVTGTFADLGNPIEKVDTYQKIYLGLAITHNDSTGLRFRGLVRLKGSDTLCPLPKEIINPNNESLIESDEKVIVGVPGFPSMMFAIPDGADQFTIQVKADNLGATAAVIDEAGIARATNSDVVGVQADKFPQRHNEPVQEYQTASGATTKISYTVTAGKQLFIEHWHVSVSEGNKNIFELQDDGTGVASIGNGENGGNTAPMPIPKNNPLGPFAAGSVITITRIEGDSGKDWSGGFVGYEEDV